MKPSNLLGLSCVVALIAMLWSLYYWYFGDPVIALSNGVFWDRANGLPPCEMCRYARIMMYPIIITTIVWLLQKEIRWAAVSQIILSGLWIILMVYLYGMQKLWWASLTCDRRATVSCYDISVDYFWFLTIPLLALTAFVILFVLWIVIYTRKQHPITTL